MILGSRTDTLQALEHFESFQEPAMKCVLLRGIIAFLSPRKLFTHYRCAKSKLQLVIIYNKEKDQGTMSYAIMSTNTASYLTIGSCDNIARH